MRVRAGLPLVRALTSGYLALQMAVVPNSAVCSTLIKSAEDSIAKASAMTLSPEASALVERSKVTLEEAKKNYASGKAKIDYANCMWRAQTAKAQAEAAAAISKP